jgi:predicted acetyltransferase
MDENMKFIEPKIEYEEQIRTYRQELLNSGSSMDGTGALRRMEDPRQWIEHCKRSTNKETVLDGLVPATQYIFVRESDDKIIGMLQIRHYLNDFLEKYGGHIGYSVAPSERRKGYATQMLQIGLNKCKELGIYKVLITCDDDNEASRKTILNNGGVYESTVYEPDEGVNLQRYWIELSEK